ncbi:MAG: methionine--tRNA ligase, partial [Acidobacteria bacterium]|nr:methionine--tRNA ligase [Acidobacteriota bacterium]
FFLTGTDENAAKVVDAALEHGMTAQAWADRNAEAFKDTFRRLELSNDDFIRTTEDRHEVRVLRYVEQLLASGDVYLGEYEGWYDAGQEEYVPETKARDGGFVSPFNGKPLVRRKEHNYFFRLSRYAGQLLDLLESDRLRVRPEARRNEVMARIREGLNDVPISRAGGGGWGIPVPGDPEHTIYVWIDALLNYLTTVDTDERRAFWPAQVHFMAKDILWFHAVIWPGLLLALQARPGNEWIGLPEVVYAHSFWIREGQKMSKSLGNFIDLEEIERYVGDFGVEGLRYFLVTQGPLGTADGDFAEERLLDLYNADLANTLGNCLSRVSNMIGRYCEGKVPAPGPRVEGGSEHGDTAERCVERHLAAMDGFDLAGAAAAALDLVRAIDGYIDRTRPFALAKDPERMPEVGTVLYNCAEALRIASVLLWPLLPAKMTELWRRFGLDAYVGAVKDRGRGDLLAWTVWGQLEPGTEIERGEALFPRIDKEKYLETHQTPAVAPAAAKSEEPGGGQITIDQFFETVLKVGTVRAAEKVPKSSKLLKLTVDLGEESERTVVAGIAKEYAPDDLVGRQVVVVANLQPAKLMGIESQGMVLAASIDGRPVVLHPGTEVPAGTRVR